MDSIPLRLIYDGIGPVHWSGPPLEFGVQDKSGALHSGSKGHNQTVVFDLTLHLKALDSAAPIFSGNFVHGPPDGRFLYLAWRNEHGGFAQRLKLPLASITWEQARLALARQLPMTGTLVDHHPKATTTGANIGGLRPIVWALAGEA